MVSTRFDGHQRTPWDDAVASSNARPPDPIAVTGVRPIPIDDPDRPTLGDMGALMANARALADALRAGDSLAGLLNGRNIGLVSTERSCADSLLFAEAATELGARVSHLRPSLADAGTPGAVQQTARMLARLYDAVECQGMSHDAVKEVGEAARIPVYDGIASPGHPTASLVDRLDPDRSQAQRRRLLVQAILIGTIGAR
jgi:ornithine carbamoyltransferase